VSDESKRKEPEMRRPRNKVPRTICRHGALERVGGLEVFCYDCLSIAFWHDVLAKKKDAWRPLGP